MRVCLISVEIFAWGKYGGFGRATRILGRELAKRGVEVTAVVPRRMNQRPVEYLDGIKVLSFKPSGLSSATRLFQEANADIYHSQEPSLGTYLAQLAMPDRKHIVTFRDPRDPSDWLIELRLPSASPSQVITNWVYEDNWLVRRAVYRADRRFAAAKVLIPKARKKYHLDDDPEFLPTPVFIPTQIVKAKEPTVCFVSRWDKRKRPELFFELAKSFPEVRFLAAGKSRNAQWDQYLRQTYGGLPNVEMLGFVDQFQSDKLFRLLESSWISINTAAREGLPNSFIESAAHQCAILSSVDPDQFASRFGCFVQDDNFVKGLSSLLEDDHWRDCAARGYDYVSKVFALDRAVEQHLRVYQEAIDRAPE